MKIIAPISRIEEIEPLAAAGADEFYCGLVPEEWTRSLGTSGVNRRLFGNLQTYEQLAEAVRLAHGQGRQLSLVMNAQHYDEARSRALIVLAHRFADLGGDALIVGDIGLLALLAASASPLRLQVSSLLTCRNSEAAALYRDLGAHRIILPRDVTLAEIEAMASGCDAIEFEAFVLNDGCVFEEGSCHTIHLPPGLGGPICLDRYTMDIARRDEQALSPREHAAFERHAQRYQEWLWQRFGQGFNAATARGYPAGPCGLCAMPRLAAAGVAAVKIAGREAPMSRKIKSVELVSLVRDRVRRGDDAQQVRQYASELRGDASMCERALGCYYGLVS